MHARGEEYEMKRQRKRHTRPVGRQRTSATRYSTLTVRQKDLYDRTTNLITDLRRGDGPYTKLRRKHHLGSTTARKYGGRDLIGGSRGKPVRASKSDRRVRDLMFPTVSGDVPIRTRSSRDATKLSEFFHDRDNLLRGKLSPDDFEAHWRGVIIAGEEVFADSAAILTMADADELLLENLYASAVEDR
jgi:hypothetical protein